MDFSLSLSCSCLKKSHLCYGRHLFYLSYGPFESCCHRIVLKYQSRVDQKFDQLYQLTALMSYDQRAWQRPGCCHPWLSHLRQASHCESHISIPLTTIVVSSPCPSSFLPWFTICASQALTGLTSANFWLENESDDDCRLMTRITS